MLEFSIKEIIRAARATLIRKGGFRDISGISTDTRHLKHGDLFIALKGKNFNGHDFVQAAITKGASCVIIQKAETAKVRAVNSFDAAVLQVGDTLEAFGDIARYHRNKFDIPFIGITGSNGKTTAKEMLFKVLSSAFRVLKNEGTENNLIGLPQTLLRLDNAYDIGVLELGTNQFGEIERLSRVLMPRIGVITNIGPSHLEFLKSEKGVLREKAELFKSLGRDGIALVNSDDPNILGIKQLKCRTLTFGINNKCDFRAAEIVQEEDGLLFTVNEEYDFKMRVLGRHNVYNALIAVSVAFTCDMKYDEIYKALYDFQPVAGRLSLKRAGGLYIIDDTYNSNPQSAAAAIGFLKDYRARARKIFVCADMLELGSHADSFHADVGRAAARAGIDCLVSVGNFSEVIRQAALESGMRKDCVYSCPDKTAALKFLKTNLKYGDTVLFKGSRRMALEGIMHSLIAFLSDKNEAVKLQYL